MVGGLSATQSPAPRTSLAGIRTDTGWHWRDELRRLFTITADQIATSRGRKPAAPVAPPTPRYKLTLVLQPILLLRCQPSMACQADFNSAG
ncbi:hypothetical protein E2C01_066420 [Portunus trituberculatus]|uniref:Uncharacterized protein n=1 Tax=Portunus trituberculatus TaxID=210409 RepID=A0A5B7HQF6_PORTR|nr:hypothetical protein [Portunus trituberculatus]